MLTLGISGIWSIMRRTLIPAQPGRETNSRVQPVPLYNRTDTVLDVVRNLRHTHPRADVLAGGLTHLAVHLCCAPDGLIGLLGILREDALCVPLFFRRCAPEVT